MRSPRLASDGTTIKGVHVYHHILDRAANGGSRVAGPETFQGDAPNRRRGGQATGPRCGEAEIEPAGKVAEIKRLRAEGSRLRWPGTNWTKPSAMHRKSFNRSTVTAVLGEEVTGATR